MSDFDDLLAANQSYAQGFSDGGFDGIARAGVAVVTCMDSRIEPLAMLGLKLGDAKILRTPGGRITPDALIGCILGVHVLNVDRIMVVPHTRCAMASGTDADIAERILTQNGVDIRGMTLGANPDQERTLDFDVRLLASHPLIDGRAQVGGFLYDVDSGLLTQLH
ncbi:beta-class carbonic anhydrase [Aestuariimicrobium sp. T2.26MG-19.2B]|uniref:beta-class carbonic anhydrase n=1 Tax=Aestuariimicrobium sp. T2.26MG-19.2B TaxID=3040679 RepID=UPI0024775418|nr:carbonic anhydrase [Aestuariimicrobium sp. T2.26MG-19.2B]CAI9408685.1 Beta-carbonic anhydrase 1 [Aestuariimicrobium sp. T2.26MG-19.2B]